MDAPRMPLAAFLLFVCVCIAYLLYKLCAKSFLFWHCPMKHNNWHNILNGLCKDMYSNLSSDFEGMCFVYREWQRECLSTTLLLSSLCPVLICIAWVLIVVVLLQLVCLFDWWYWPGCWHLLVKCLYSTLSIPCTACSACRSWLKRGTACPIHVLPQNSYVVRLLSVVLFLHSPSSVFSSSYWCTFCTLRCLHWQDFVLFI